ncbi:MAG TPA: sodium/solute symporter [Phycisphaerae bacterium]|nr:sodium/solute symporter [Phycisphaerae bacterium]
MLLAEISPPLNGFGWPDWLVVAAYLVLTTILGAALSGRASTIRDFFLGGRKLPWWAICGSIVATEVSAATIVGVPTISFAAGGNLTYLQLALGSILARFIIARYFINRYYEHEIYSPYDYVGTRLGPRVRQTTTGLFFVGAVLGQGARLYITAFVLSVVAGINLTTAIWLMGAFAVGWTLIGGMVTVIWTDVIQFVVMVVGAGAALIAAVVAVPGGFAEVARFADQTDKLRLFNLSPDLSVEYTLWCGLLALPFLNLAAFGTDQVMAQRFFCCKTQADARKAVLWSNISLFIPVLMLFVGIAIAAYFQHASLTTTEQALMKQDKNYLLPLFIVHQLPVGLRGLVVAAIFAAAISTLEGALAALSQATVGLVYPADRLAGEEDRRTAAGRMSLVVLSKLLVIGWGVALCLMAIGCITIAKQYKNVIDLALSLVRYTYGPLLGIFLLAFLRRPPDDRGLFWAVGLAIMAVIGMSIHDLKPVLILGRMQDLSDAFVWSAAALASLVGWFRFRLDAWRPAIVAATSVLIVLLHHLQVGTTPHGDPLRMAAYWHYPIAALMTFAVGYLLGRRDEEKQMQ